ncbi:MAG: DUF2000 domain-containing protein [Nocardioidaceae bacterium]
MESLIGWAPEEIQLDQPTRMSRHKWVIVVNEALPAGLAANAAACLAATVGQTVPGVLGPAGKDAAGAVHPGLPWAGCTILAAPVERLTRIRAGAAASTGMHHADMPEIAQTNRVYGEYLDQLATTDTDRLPLHAVSLLGPRNRVDKLVRTLPLLQ